jgi:hypothetical protein
MKLSVLPIDTSPDDVVYNAESNEPDSSKIGLLIGFGFGVKSRALLDEYRVSSWEAALPRKIPQKKSVKEK